MLLGDLVDLSKNKSMGTNISQNKSKQMLIIKKQTFQNSAGLVKLAKRIQQFEISTDFLSHKMLL